MRIIAELPHPVCKITLFKMGQKYIIKLEQGQLEQCYKIAETDLLKNDVNEIFEMLDETFMETVSGRFKAMRSDFLSTYNRYQ